MRMSVRAGHRLAMQALRRARVGTGGIWMLMSAAAAYSAAQVGRPPRWRRRTAGAGGAMRSRVRGRAVAAGVLSLSLGGLMVGIGGPGGGPVQQPGHPAVHRPERPVRGGGGRGRRRIRHRPRQQPGGRGARGRRPAEDTADGASANPLGWRWTRRGTCTSPTPATTRWWRCPPGDRPSQQDTIGSGFGEPTGVAVDAAGTYTSPTPATTRWSRCPPSASRHPPSTGLNKPFGVAVDKAGDVYVADTVNSRVVELPAGATSSGQQITLPFTGLDSPFGLAVDAAGDVYVADTGNDRVVELPAGATSSSQQVTLPFALSDPDGVAVDKAGDVYVADSLNDRVVGLAALTPLAVTTTSLPGGQVGAAYSQTLAAARHRAVHLVGGLRVAAGRAEPQHRRGDLRDADREGQLQLHRAGGRLQHAADDRDPGTVDHGVPDDDGLRSTDSRRLGLGEITAGPDGNVVPGESGRGRRGPDREDHHRRDLDRVRLLQ